MKYGAASQGSLVRVELNQPVVQRPCVRANVSATQHQQPSVSKVPAPDNHSGTSNGCVELDAQRFRTVPSTGSMSRTTSGLFPGPNVLGPVRWQQVYLVPDDVRERPAGGEAHELMRAEPKDDGVAHVEVGRHFVDNRHGPAPIPLGRRALPRRGWPAHRHSTTMASPMRAV